MLWERDNCMCRFVNRLYIRNENGILQGAGQVQMSKPHLAAIMKQISGSNYHAYKIDESP